MSLKRATLCVGVHYDDENTDPEALASALDSLLGTALSTPGILDDYGAVHFEEFYSTQDYAGNYMHTVNVLDQAHEKVESLPMRIEEDGCGVALRAIKPGTDETLGGTVILDYHDNRLRVVVFTADDEDNPIVSYVLVDDVSKALKK